MSRIQLHLIQSNGKPTPISIDVKAIAYFHQAEHQWCEGANSDLLINTRLITVSEPFAEIAKRIAEALSPTEPWRTNE
jgi:hypothetical protein